MLLRYMRCPVDAFDSEIAFLWRQYDMQLAMSRATITFLLPADFAHERDLAAFNFGTYAVTKHFIWPYLSFSVCDGVGQMPATDVVSHPA